MKTKYLALSLAVGLAALAVGCSRTEPPKPAAKKSVAETFASPAQDATPPPPTAPAAETRPVAPDQIPYVGTAPPGQVAFGPSVPGAGTDPVGDREREQYNQDRIKDNELKAQQAAREQAQPSVKPAPAKAPAQSGGQKGTP